MADSSTVATAAGAVFTGLGVAGRWLGENGDAISLAATVVGIGVCALAAAACLVAAGVSMAISAGAAAAQSYNKHGDLRRAGIQAVASIGIDAITGAGAGKLAAKVFGSATGIGRAAIDMHGAPLVFGMGMGVEAGIDSLCDLSKGSVC